MALKEIYSLTFSYESLYFLSVFRKCLLGFHLERIQFSILPSSAGNEKANFLSGKLGKNGGEKAKVIEVTLREAVQLEMKSKLRHEKSYPVLACAGNMI